MTVAGIERRGLLFVVGKGGVGKTTTAAALACASDGPSLGVSIDSAHSLNDALGLSYQCDKRLNVAAKQNVSVLQLPPDAFGNERDGRPLDLREYPILSAFSWLRENGVPVDIEGNLRCLRLVDLVLANKNGENERIVVDTQSTQGLYDLTKLMKALYHGTDILSGKGGKTFLAFLGIIAPSLQGILSNGFTEKTRSLADRLSIFEELIHDSKDTGFVLVTEACNGTVYKETERALDLLIRQQFPLAGIVVNKYRPTDDEMVVVGQLQSAVKIRGICAPVVICPYMTTISPERLEEMGLKLYQ